MREEYRVQIDPNETLEENRFGWHMGFQSYFMYSDFFIEHHDTISLGWYQQYNEYDECWTLENKEKQEVYNILSFVIIGDSVVLQIEYLLINLEIASFIYDYLRGYGHVRTKAGTTLFLYLSVLTTLRKVPSHNSSKRL